MARTRQPPPEIGSDTRREVLRDQPREVLVALLEELAMRYPASHPTPDPGADAATDAGI